MNELVTQIIAGVAVAVILAASIKVRGWYKKIRDVLAGLEGVKDMQLIQTGVVSLKDAPDERAFRVVEGDPQKREVETRLRVPFKPAFETEPAVAVSLRKIDLGDENPAKIHRLAVSYESVTRKDFVLCFKTKKETLVFDAEATWIAIGRPSLDQGAHQTTQDIVE